MRKRRRRGIEQGGLQFRNGFRSSDDPLPLSLSLSYSYSFPSPSCLSIHRVASRRSLPLRSFLRTRPVGWINPVLVGCCTCQSKRKSERWREREREREKIRQTVKRRDARNERRNAAAELDGKAIVGRVFTD